MKTRTKIVLMSALALTLIGATFVMADQAGSDSCSAQTQRPM